MFENFLKWVRLKFDLSEKHNKEEYKPRLFKERQIWWCAIGQNIGTESNGKSNFYSRPVLVYKKLSKNNFIGIPLTSQIKEGTWYVKINQESKNSCVMLHQIRNLDEKRLYSIIGELDDKDWSKVQEGFNNLYTKNIPPIKGAVGKSQM